MHNIIVGTLSNNTIEESIDKIYMLTMIFF